MESTDLTMEERARILEDADARRTIMEEGSNSINPLTGRPYLIGESKKPIELETVLPLQKALLEMDYREGKMDFNEWQGWHVLISNLIPFYYDQPGFSVGSIKDGAGLAAALDAFEPIFDGLYQPGIPIKNKLFFDFDKNPSNIFRLYESLIREIPIEKDLSSKLRTRYD